VSEHIHSIVKKTHLFTSLFHCTTEIIPCIGSEISCVKIFYQFR